MSTDHDTPSTPEDRARVRIAAIRRRETLLVCAEDLERMALRWLDRDDRGWERNVCLSSADELRQLAGGALE